MSTRSELDWLRRVRDVCHLLASETESSVLLPRILDSAIELAGAERGFLVLLERGRAPGRPKIRVEVARGFDRQTLRGPDGQVSRTVVQRVIEERRGLVSSEADSDVLDVSSVRDRRVQSILCFPLLLRGDCRGVLYLDHRFTRGAFSARDLPILQTFADHAALVIETLELARGPLPSPVSDASTGARAASQLGDLLGDSEVMRPVYLEVERASRCREPVLIVAEPGCGQELVAREIHARGEDGDAPFVSASCRDLASSALEDLVRGRAGAGVPGGRGLLERAGSGTLFLEDSERMPPSLQEILLGILSARGQARRPACRVVVSSAPGLRALVEAGSFRADLYYRLDVMRVSIPPLRSHPEDVVPLFAAFSRRARGRVPSLSPKARLLLTSYSWPGNVSELRDESLRLVDCGRARISTRQLPARIQEGRGVSRAEAGLAGKTLAEAERELVSNAMVESGGNKAEAARALGVARGTLYHLLRRHGLS